MIERILPLLNRLIPQGLAFKGLSKVNPRLGMFIANATAAGYAGNEVLDFLRQQTGQEPQEGLRPDEQAAEARVQQGKVLPAALGKAAQIGLGTSAIGAVPGVIGNLFQGQDEEQQQQSMQGQQMQQPNQNNTDQALLAALEKILQM